MNRILVALVVLFCVAASATALKCYVCQANDNGCLNPSSNMALLKDCPNASNCYKTSTMVGSNENVVRGCGKAPAQQGQVTTGDNACNIIDLQGVKQTLCNCIGDSCNSASGVKMSLGAAVVMLLLAKLI